MDFQQANSANLAIVTPIMAWEYIMSDIRYSLSEIRGAKNDRAMRSAYVDNSIGFVKLKRDGSLCTILGQICPEHKVRTKNYTVKMEIDESEEKIISVECQDCPASEGGCKHSLAFLMWMQARSLEPSPTEIISYWKKPRLSNIGRKEHVTCKDFGAKDSARTSSTTGGSLTEEFLAELPPGYRCMLSDMRNVENMWDALDIFKLAKKFKRTGGNTFEDFLGFVKSHVNDELCAKACQETIRQAESLLWHTLRYGRCTASTIYDIAHCRTSGVLLEKILGASNIQQTAAMERGKNLEPEVLKVFTQIKKQPVRSTGFLVSTEYPLFGASPDGIGDDFVVEIKCPSSEKTVTNYIKNGALTYKSMAQVQLQMLIHKKTKCYFILADPHFEENKKITIFPVPFIEHLVKNLIEMATNYYKRFIFPRIIS